MSETITVQTTDADRQKVELKLNISIPITFRLEPGQAMWSVGAPADTRDVFFYDVKRTGMKPVQVYSPSENFKASLMPDDQNNRYIIRIQVLSTKAEETTPIYVDVDMGDGVIRKSRIIAFIRGPNTKVVRGKAGASPSK